MFSNLMNALFGINTRPDLEQKQDVAVAVIDVNHSPSVSKVPQGKYDADVEAIQKKYGELKSGLCIEAILQELLTICPRNRPRTDAYQGLVSFLMSEYGVTLTIKSRKRK